MYAQKIINFANLLERSTERFIGRGWVREAVDDFLAAEGPRYFLLLGEPGSGKTTFLAKLVEETQYPHHFIGIGSRLDVEGGLDWRDPVRFAESIGYQLLRDYGGWVMDWASWGIEVHQHMKELKGRLVGAEIGAFHATARSASTPKLAIEQGVEQFGPAAEVIGVFVEKFVMDVEQVVRQLFLAPLRRIADRYPDNQIVLVVDALDEAAEFSNPQQSIVKMLELGSLPANVRIICSSRPGPHLTHAFLHQAKPFWLSQDERGYQDERLLNDAELYVQQLVGESQVAALLAANGKTAEQLVPAVAGASQGNFLYLFHYAAELHNGDVSLLDLTTLPQGLYGIYGDFLRKIREKREAEMSWTKVYKRVLGILAVAEDALTRRQIATFAEVSEEDAGTILLDLGQFLARTRRGAEQRYALYHRSFAEFLVSEENEDFIDPVAAHRHIAEHIRQRYHDWPPFDSTAADATSYAYALNHVVHHTMAGYDSSERHQVLQEIFSDNFFEVRADVAGWHMPALRDLERAAQVTPHSVIPVCLRLLQGKKRNSLVSQQNVRLLRKVRRDLAKEGPGPVLARPRKRSDKVVDEAIQALELESTAAVRELDRLLGTTSNAQVRGAIAVALGETSTAEAIEPLRKLLLVEDRTQLHASWCSADGLIALELQLEQEQELTEELIRNVNREELKPSTRHRILYVLGRRRVKLPLEEAMRLTDLGVRHISGGGRAGVRSVDLIWLLLPREIEPQEKWVCHFVPQLEAILGANKKGDRYLEPLSKDEWRLRRVVTALGRIGPPEARRHLEQLLSDLDLRAKRWPTPQSEREIRERRALKQAIGRAMEDLLTEDLLKRQPKGRRG